MVSSFASTNGGANTDRIVFSGSCENLWKKTNERQGYLWTIHKSGWDFKKAEASKRSLAIRSKSLNKLRGHF